jgi:hypothetical protein
MTRSVLFGLLLATVIALTAVGVSHFAQSPSVRKSSPAVEYAGGAYAA